MTVPVSWKLFHLAAGSGPFRCAEGPLAADALKLTCLGAELSCVPISHLRLHPGAQLSSSLTG